MVKKQKTRPPKTLKCSKSKIIRNRKREVHIMLILWQYGNFPDNLEIYRTFWKLPDNLVTCQTIWKLSRPSIISRLNGKFPDKTKTFQKIQKHSRQSGNFSDNPEPFQKLQWFSRQVLDIIDKSMFSAKTFWTRKLSGEQCFRAPYVFLSLSYIPTFLHSYIPTFLHSYIHTFLRFYILTFLHS